MDADNDRLDAYVSSPVSLLIAGIPHSARDFRKQSKKRSGQLSPARCCSLTLVTRRPFLRLRLPGGATPVPVRLRRRPGRLLPGPFAPPARVPEPASRCGNTPCPCRLG